jgi:hypothetical protein
VSGGADSQNPMRANVRDHEHHRTEDAHEQGISGVGRRGLKVAAQYVVDGASAWKGEHREQLASALAGAYRNASPGAPAPSPGSGTTLRVVHS